MVDPVAVSVLDRAMKIVLAGTTAELEVGRILKEEGFSNTRVLSTCHEILRTLTKDSVDLIFCGLREPEADGTTLFMELRSRAEIQHIPLVLLAPVWQRLKRAEKSVIIERIPARSILGFPRKEVILATMELIFRDVFRTVI